jgi:hypothetical protein
MSCRADDATQAKPLPMPEVAQATASHLWHPNFRQRLGHPTQSFFSFGLQPLPGKFNPARNWGTFEKGK